MRAQRTYDWGLSRPGRPDRERLVQQALADAALARMLARWTSEPDRRIAVGLATALEVQLIGSGVAVVAGAAEARRVGDVIELRGAVPTRLDLTVVHVDRQQDELRSAWLAARGADDTSPASISTSALARALNVSEEAA